MMAGLSVAAAAFAAKQLVQVYAKLRAAPPAMRAFYKVSAGRSVQAVASDWPPVTAFTALYAGL
jgi:hypothetical protein